MVSPVSPQPEVIMVLSKKSKALFLLYLLVSVQAVYGYDYQDQVKVGQSYKDPTVCPKKCRKYDNDPSGYFIFKVVIGGLGGTIVVVAAPVILVKLGFTAGGIVAGSFAAKLMALLAPTKAGGVVAVLQYYGAAGIPLSVKAWLFSIFSFFTGGVATILESFWEWFNESDDYKNPCCCSSCPF